MRRPRGEFPTVRCLSALLLGAAVGVTIAVVLAARAERMRVDFSADGRVSWSFTGAAPEDPTEP